MTFVQGIDYGPRDGTLGISFHMSEGGDDLPHFLSRHSGEDLHQWAARVNGVSCHAAILSTGQVVQMLDWGHASGNLNPADRAGEYGYYGHHHLEAVLGPVHWKDPNTWTVSAEIAGHRADGPTDAQVKAAIVWGLDMRHRFPTIRGATGHHDQSPKGCPGVKPNMKAIFEGVGGHGLWTPVQEVEVPIVTTIERLPFGGTFEVPAGRPVTSFRVDPISGKVLVGPKLNAIATARVFRYDANVSTTATRGEPFIRVSTGPQAGWIISSTGLGAKPDVAPLVDTATVQAKERDRVKAAAIAAIGAIQ